MAIKQLIVTDKALREGPRDITGFPDLNRYIKEVMGLEGELISVERDWVLRAYIIEFGDGDGGNSNF